MQIIENWADIEGKIIEQKPSNENKGFYEVKMMVEQVKDVPDFPNLLNNTEGQSLVVNLPEELVDKLNIANDSRISCRIRKASLNQQFVHRQHLKKIQPDS